MMKIHTTQNLDSIRDISTNNVTMPKEIRYNYLEKARMSALSDEPDTYEREKLSFKGKKSVLNKAMAEARAAGKKEIWLSRKANKMFDKVLDRSSFDSLLDLMSHEVFVQAAIACLVCSVARPLTIMGMALTSKTQDEKDNYKYAAGHSIASGFTSLLGSLIIAQPFSLGAKHLKGHMIEKLDEKILKEMYPNLKIESIWKDASKTERNSIKEWLDVQGNKFSNDYKNVMKVAKPKFIEDFKPETLKDFGVDVDVAAMKGKSVNEWTDRNGKKLHFELKDMFIRVDDSEIKDRGKFFSLGHIDENFLKEIYPELDIKSISKDGERLHTDFWKNVDGSDFKLDMDTICLSSYKEAKSAVPLHTGRTRVETKTGEIKYLAYQRNNGLNEKFGTVPSKLGSEIKQEWLDNDLALDIAHKSITWLPDMLTRPLVAAGTIALLPMILKNVFGLEKHKKKPAEEVAKEVKMEPIQQNKQADTIAKEVSVAENQKQVSFKGKAPKKKAVEKFAEKIGEVYAKYYAKPFYNQMWLHKFSKKVAKVPGSYTEHMSALGSAITSSVYMKRTLDNKDLDDNKKKTLAVNQGLCFVIPTFLSYYVNGKLAGFNKKQEYDYGFRQDKKKASGLIKPENLEKFEKRTGERLKGFGTFSSLLTFTLIYRYASPVLITPLANWSAPFIEKLWGGKNGEKAKEVKLETAQKQEQETKKVA